MINFRYIGYGTSFIAEYSGKNNQKKDYLYIFNDNRMKSIFSKKMRWNFFNAQPTLLTFNELKEQIFYTDKVILKEAKRILAFYTSIPKDIKEELGIKSYYDVIDFANDFFDYYREIKINKVDKIENIQNWQEKYFLHFEKIKESFDRLLEKYNYIPSDWIEDLQYYKKDFFGRFNKIIFVDIVEFEKVYRDIIVDLGEKKEVEIALQMEKGSFDEENLKFSETILPETSPSNIFIYQSKDELEESMSLIYLLKEKAKKGEFYSPAPENSEFFNLFPFYFGKSQAVTMNDTKLYAFLNVQLNLLLNMEERLGETYNLLEFEKAFENRAFKEYYSLTEEDIRLIKKISSNFYQYISLDILHSNEVQYLISEDIGFTKKLEKIFKDFSSILKLKSVDELYNYFKNEISLDKFIQKEYGDVFEKFFEIFGIMKENENMSIHKSFKSYFDGNLGIALLKLTIQYMKDIAIASNEKVDSERVIIKNIESALYANETKHLFRDQGRFSKTNFFIDITSDLMPGNIKDNLIFTEKQRKELNLTTKEEKREIKKYRFFQMIFTNRNSVIFTKKNEDKGIDISPFIDELCIKYDLKINSAPIELNKSIEILKKSIPSSVIGNLEFKKGEFSKEESDFKDNRLNIGAYDYDNLVKCPLKFYFQKLAQLIPEKDSEVDYLNKQFLGTMVHKILENIVRDIWKDVLSKGIYEIDREVIVEAINREIKNNRSKILVQMDIYLQEILIPLLSENIEIFFKKLASKYRNINIRRFQGEKDAGKNTPFIQDKIDVYLRGKADLVIESDMGNEIIDYKTGGAQEAQLDYYSIILFGDETKAEKTIFNVIKGDMKAPNKVELTKEGLKENILEFLDNPFYIRNEKKNVCENNGHSCEYIDICGKKRDL
ncbi:MAG: PD-(D/E)XK nuclease family protein [Fusobacterium sp.]|uniref:PD-(D/E)XK nuclease family protein n=1 Tax=Fusobacterium sp. TaxID=68766 RepID=UPI00294322B4|nr:PD-(D/E)XK nuclease family protein [Fusobacterium sp.]MDY3058591.1 PD-(D/E)XK nuclease family protein [Fusobacterium sp.]MEE1476769.1 PD-(D/E)XK nuclease family protein [Fusobacterium sp.]